MAQIALVVVEKVFLGEIWTNTHAVAVPDLSPPLATDGLDAITGGFTAFPDALTNVEDPLYGGSGSILCAVLGFEREMMGTQVAFTRMYVSDGKTTGVGTGAFATFPLSFLGRALDVGDPELAPLSIVLQVNRVPLGFSTRTGRMQLRAALTKDEIQAGQIDGVKILPAAVAAVTSRLQGAVNSSALDTYFASGSTLPEVVYGIPHYAPKSAGSAAGSITDYSPVTDFVMKDAASRQVQRGRKRS